MKLIQYYILLLFTLIALTVRAQLYPVQVVPTVNAPYSSKLADYANPLGGRMQLQLITTDLNIQNRSVQLHLEIKGNGLKTQSLPILNVRTLRISGGEITSLSQSDLAPYFKPENLQGLSMQQYAQPLPDGVYSFCWRVRDVQSGKWLSGSQCTTIYLMLNDPPQLNLPTDNERVAVGNFPNIIFSWTPRHLNATNVTYEFELRELLDPSLDPRFAFEVNRKVLKESDLRMTTLLYDLSKPNLIPGHRYGWRVRAVSTAGLVQNSVFKNDGYSEVHSFVYASDCKAPWGLVVTEESPARIRLQWQGDSAHRQYHIQYRKANVVGAEWFDTNTKGTEAYLTDLEGGETYEVRVGASCELSKYGVKPSYTYSAITRFEVKKSPTAADNGINCGVASEIKITDRKLLASLVVNETFTANDFTIKVLEVSGGNGVFTGKGYVEVPFLSNAKLAVVFNNIQINSSHQLIGGVVEADYNKSWSDVVEVKSIEDAITSVKTYFKKHKEIAQKEKELSEQLKGKHISEEEYQQKRKDIDTEIATNNKQIDAVDEFIQSDKFIDERDKKKISESTSYFKSLGSKQSVDNNQYKKYTDLLNTISRKREEKIVEARKILSNLSQEQAEKTCDEQWTKKAGKIGEYDLDYIAYKHCSKIYGTMFLSIKGGSTFYFLVTAFDLYPLNGTQDVSHSSYYYIYNPANEKWERFFPEFRKFYRDPMPEELKSVILGIVDYMIPIENGYILFTGKNLEGEEGSRIVAGIAAGIEIGLTFTIVGKGAWKTGKGLLAKALGKAGTHAFTKSIDKTIAFLSKKAKYVLQGAGKYSIVKGHHPLAKKAFEGAVGYDYKEAFSISKKVLDNISGIKNTHTIITGQQNKLYSAWRKANPNIKLGIEKMTKIEIQAMKNAGIPEDVATGWVVKALEDLKKQGVKEIKNIPWNGVNN